MFALRCSSGVYRSGRNAVTQQRPSQPFAGRADYNDRDRVETQRALKELYLPIHGDRLEFEAHPSPLL